MSDLGLLHSETNGQPARFGVARRARKARKKDELNIEVGERITDIEKTTSDDWLSGRNSQGISGYFPVRYVEMMATTAQGELEQHPFSHLSPSKIEYHHTQNNTYVNVNGDLKNDYTLNMDASRKATLHTKNVTENTSSTTNHTTTNNNNTSFKSKQGGGLMSWDTDSIMWILPGADGPDFGDPTRHRYTRLGTLPT